jgi:cell pole-organizing protein PopZ
MNIEELGLEGEQAAKVAQLIESVKSEGLKQLEELSASVKKLEANNEKLLGEKITANQKAQAAEEEKLRATGNIKQLEETISQRLTEEYEAKLTKERDFANKLKDQALSTHKEKVVSDLIKGFKEPDLFKLTFSNLVEAQMTDDGIVTSFKDLNGSVVTTDASQYQKWISEQPQLSGYIVASHAAGSNATNATATASGKTKTISRSMFDSLGNNERHDYIKQGGAVIDD